MNSVKSVFSGSVWGIASKVIAAVAKFFTIPMLVAYYGKSDYGLIALAFSLNAYLRLMDIGLNIGAVRFFSIWLSQNEQKKITEAANSSTVFYGIVGIINAAIFIVLSRYAFELFHLSGEQAFVFKWMMYLLALTSVFNWTSNVVTQLLTAYGDLAWLNRVGVISSVLDWCFAIIAVKLHQSLDVYFFFYIVSTMIVIPLNLYKLKRHGVSLKSMLTPKWHRNTFKDVFSYSFGIFAMGIFQFSADSLRPLFLGKYASGGVAVLTDFRIIQTISSFVMMFGGVFIQALLPFMSRLEAQDSEQISKLIYRGTKYVSIFVSFFIFLLILNAKSVLVLYMGISYVRLEVWLILWLITLLGMHTSVVSSLILSKGNTKPIAIMAAISCTVSLTITALLAHKYDIGAAVIGYLVYIIMQNLFYYLYYMPKILLINCRKLFFNSFSPSVLVGVLAIIAGRLVNKFVFVDALILKAFIESVIYTFVFLIILTLFIIKPNEQKQLFKKFF